jgi:hypothetical protein
MAIITAMMGSINYMFGIGEQLQGGNSHGSLTNKEDRQNNRIQYDDYFFHFHTKVITLTGVTVAL